MVYRQDDGPHVGSGTEPGKHPYEKNLPGSPPDMDKEAKENLGPVHKIGATPIVIDELY